MVRATMAVGIQIWQMWQSCSEIELQGAGNGVHKGMLAEGLCCKSVLLT